MIHADSAVETVSLLSVFLRLFAQLRRIFQIVLGRIRKFPGRKPFFRHDFIYRTDPKGWKDTLQTAYNFRFPMPRKNQVLPQKRLLPAF